MKSHRPNFLLEGFGIRTRPELAVASDERIEAYLLYVKSAPEAEILSLNRKAPFHCAWR